jgi:predicted nucleic acid-binding protein
MDFNIVVDASVAIKWYIKDESEINEAVDILLDYEVGKIKFFVPRLFYYETANVIHIAVQRKRITEDEGKNIINDMLEIKTTLVDSGELIRDAYRNARKYNISVYDAHYLGVAKEHGMILYTADRKLYNSVKEKKKYVKWIGDYKRLE